MAHFLNRGMNLIPFLYINKKKVFLVVLIFTAPNNFERRNGIRQTWLNDETSDTLHYFVVGIKGIAEEMNVTIQSENRRFSDLLILPHLKR